MNYALSWRAYSVRITIINDNGGPITFPSDVDLISSVMPESGWEDIEFGSNHEGAWFPLFENKTTVFRPAIRNLAKKLGTETLMLTGTIDKVDIVAIQLNGEFRKDYDKYYDKDIRYVTPFDVPIRGPWGLKYSVGKNGCTWCGIRGGHVSMVSSNEKDRRKLQEYKQKDKYERQ